MKHLFLLTYQAFHRGEGGGTLYAATIARRALSEGYRVTLLARSPDENPHETVIDGIRIVELSGYRIRRTRFWRVLDKDIGFALAVRGYLSDHAQEIDLLHSIIPDITSAIPRALRSRTIISVIEDFWSKKPSRAHQFFAAYQRFQAGIAVRTCYRVTLPSETSLSVFCKWFPRHTDHYAVVQDFVDARLFSPSSLNPSKFAAELAGEEPLIFVPQRAVEMKRVDTMIRALPAVLATFPNTIVAIAGGGPLEANHQKLARELGVMDHVRWLGMVSYKNDMPTLYRIAHLVVITSSSEGAQPSPTASEAMACGTPVIMTEACDTGRVFEGIVPTYEVGNFEQLARQIIETLKNPEPTRRNALRAREMILDRFSEEAFLQRFLRLYQGITR